MRLALFLSCGVLFWVAAIAAAPLLASSGSAAPVVAGIVVYRAASIVCHQIPERSFFLSGLPLAVCARCLGLYVGAAAAAMPAMIRGFWGQDRRSRIWNWSGPQSGVWMLLAMAAAPTAATWVLERSGFWAGSNVVRSVAALPL